MVNYVFFYRHFIDMNRLYETPISQYTQKHVKKFNLVSMKESVILS